MAQSLKFTKVYMERSSLNHLVLLPGAASVIFLYVFPEMMFIYKQINNTLSLNFFSP